MRINLTIKCCVKTTSRKMLLCLFLVLMVSTKGLLCHITRMETLQNAFLSILYYRVQPSTRECYNVPEKTFRAPCQGFISIPSVIVHHIRFGYFPLWSWYSDPSDRCRFAMADWNVLDVETVFSCKLWSWTK